MSNVEEAKVAREKLDTWLELLTHNNLPVTGLFFFWVVNTIGKQDCKQHLVLFEKYDYCSSRDVLHFMVLGRSDWKRTPG